MPIKDPTTWSLATWALATGMAVAGGFVNWYSKVKQGHTRVFNFVELIGEICTSMLCGVGVFMILASYDQAIGVCAASAGLGGHMGTRLLFLIEMAISNRVTKLADKE